MRVLVIEDETELRESLVQALREEGYAVDSSGDGEEGLYKAENWDYDAIVLDIMLPGINGWDLLKKLRETKKIPVLMLTARDGVQDRVKGLDTGADDYLVKPFDLGELFARVRAMIRRSGGEANPLIKVRDITVNTASKTVLLKESPIELTALEYSLVELMAFRKGEVVSRTDLYDHLFDEEDESMSNLLDVHVCNVRKKLGKDFIKTRRGQGYVIEE